jgi:phage-related protein
VAEGIYALHAFQKTIQKTAKQEIAFGRQRFKVAQDFDR